jgi:hypothetical protein
MTIRIRITPDMVEKGALALFAESTMSRDDEWPDNEDDFCSKADEAFDVLKAKAEDLYLELNLKTGETKLLRLVERLEEVTR